MSQLFKTILCHLGKYMYFWLGCKTILCMRRMSDGDIYKPYAIVNEHTFNNRKELLRK